MNWLRLSPLLLAGALMAACSSTPLVSGGGGLVSEMPRAAEARPAPAGPVELAKPAAAPERSSPPAPATPASPPSGAEAKMEERQRQPLKPGTLTAGDIDDNLNYAHFNRYVNQQLQRAGAGALPDAGTAARVTVRVVGANGAPVGNAAVELIAAGGEQPLLSGYTAMDGLFRFFPQRIGQWPDSYTLRVRAPGGQRCPVAQRVTLDRQNSDALVTVTLQEASPTPPSALDLAFVIDTTGSMQDELNYLKAEFSSIVEAVGRRYPNLSIRYALIVYRDQGDAYVVRSHDFTDDANTLQSALNGQWADGGGDYPEAMEQALEAAYQLKWRSGEAVRALFLVADAPPHDEQLKRALEGSRRAVELGVHIHPIAASGVGPVAEYIMRALAVTTQGRYLFLTDDSGVGLAHQPPTVPCYQVTALNQLMARLLNSELRGEREEPAQGTVIREVGRSQGGVCGADGAGQPEGGR